jgi:hypothetical protein
MVMASAQRAGGGGNAQGAEAAAAAPAPVGSGYTGLSSRPPFGERLVAQSHDGAEGQGEGAGAAAGRRGVANEAEAEGVEAAAARAGDSGLSSRPPVIVMAVVGARHVYGMERRLAEAAA